MAIELEFISLIIPIDIISKYYHGGYEQYKTDNSVRFVPENYNIWYDDELVKEGAMSPWDMGFLVKKWEDLGVKTYSEHNGKKKWENVCVVDFLCGPTIPCKWLSFDTKNNTVSLQKKPKSIETFDHLKWKDEFLKATAQKSGFRELRAAIFQGTIKLVQSSGYLVAGKQVIIDNSVIISEYFNRPIELETDEQFTTQFSVINSDCLEASQILLDSGLNPCVLNLANRQNPGGGVLGGAGAQEENIFRRTNLFMSLYQYAPYAKEYGIEKNVDSYPLDRNTGGVYSGNITVFRGSEQNGYCLLRKPYKTNVVTVPALNRPELVMKNGAYYIVDSLIEPTKQKMRTILRIAGKYHHNALVLGAFGCGAFSNPPNHIARLFQEVFDEMEFRNKFKTIVFAIFENHHSGEKHNPNGNVLPFVEVFG
ncbi:MAG: hypothetical protein Ta2B_16640 [Termitinemataceae bacterium]|nr:MAG: hypothetical protein Ta2B_16640 [Termitinemataceae bacterium]